MGHDYDHNHDGGRYNAVNGVPSCASNELLTQTARKSWGFDGYVTSDCGAVGGVQYNHKYTANGSATVQAVLRAGMDTNCDWFVDGHIRQALQDGAINLGDVDTALGHLLAVRLRLGEFDPASSNPYAGLGHHDVGHPQLALGAAEQGFVLLKNSRGTLPLHLVGHGGEVAGQPGAPVGGNGRVVAVVGPNARAGPTQLGNYHGVPASIVDVDAGLRAAVPAGVSVAYEQGCGVSGSDTSGIAPAVALASNTSTDAVVLVIGIDGTIEGEGQDRHSIALPGVQLSLVQRVAAAAKQKPRPASVVVVVMSGGPVDLAPLRDNADVDAILWVGYPGQQGGAAVARTLLDAGAAGGGGGGPSLGPAGRLTMTWHSSAFVNESNFTSMQMRPGPAPKHGTLAPGLPGRTYRFYKGSAVAYAFGTGLSYSTFTEAWAPPPGEPAALVLAAEDVRQALAAGARARSGEDRVLALACVVKNTGPRRSAHVVVATAALFNAAHAASNTSSPARTNLQDATGTGTRPRAKRGDGAASTAAIQSVVGFQRVVLSPGESTTVSFNISAAVFARHGQHGAAARVSRGRWVFRFLPSQGLTEHDSVRAAGGSAAPAPRASQSSTTLPNK